MKVVNKNKNRINREINAPKVRLMDMDGSTIGILPLSKAIEKSEEVGVDLVEISPHASPPVCKIMDYGKFLYDKDKTLKQQKKKQKLIQLKEIKFRPNTDEGDYQIKLRNLRKFLKSGYKVKITIRFRGRELAHQQIGFNVISRIRDDLDKLAIVQFFPKKIESRQIFMILIPKKTKE